MSDLQNWTTVNWTIGVWFVTTGQHLVLLPLQFQKKKQLAVHLGQTSQGETMCKVKT